MKQCAAYGLALLTVCWFCACQQESSNVRDEEIAQKVKQMEAIQNDSSLSQKEKGKKMDGLAKVFTRLYPGAPPFAKDSTERILRDPLPQTVGEFEKIERFIRYEKPAGKAPFDSAFPFPKREYFQGAATYGVRKGKKKQLVGQQGIILLVKDEGYVTEWFNVLMLNMVLKGKGQAGYDALLKGHRFEQTIEHFGQKWAVWYEPARSTPYHAATRVFITYWNHRFSMLAVSTDTTQHTPEYVGEMIDTEWLSKLRYQSKTKEP